MIDANDAALDAGVATGIQFSPVDARTRWPRRIRRDHRGSMRDQTAWRKIQRRGMKSDVSWDRSAAHYADLYATLVSGCEHR